MTFSPSALSAAAERGGKYDCPSCGQPAMFWGLRYERAEAGLVEVVWCPRCIERPLRRAWVVRQPRLPMEV